MKKCGIALLSALVMLAGCGRSAQKPVNSSAAQTAGAQNSDPPATAGVAPQQSDLPAVDAAAPEYNDLPAIDAGLSVEQAYAAIPHRRTVWDASETSVPPQESAYLGAMFKVMDQGVAARVSGLQDFRNQRFEDSRVVEQYDQLIAFVRGVQAPNTLAAFHEDVLAALTSQRQFFADWKAQRDGFQFAQQPQADPAVSSASNALHNAYNELMTKYPNESETNKEAFFDYPCALDFI